MELPSSSSESKKLQFQIFKQFATLNEKNNQFVLDYDGFIRLLTFNQQEHHSIPANTFGLIFLTIDEANKGYLTISDWFHFNNIINTNKHYQYIILYEFLRKINHQSTDKLLSINYNEKFMDFNQLFINKQALLLALQNVQKFTNTGFKINWLNFNEYLDLYTQDHAGNLSLASLITILQNDWVNYKVNQAFMLKSDPDHKITNTDMFLIFDSIYGHKLSAKFINSLKQNYSQSQQVNYTLYKDLNYIIQNFDLLNQLFIRYYRLMRSLNLTTKTTTLQPGDSNAITISKTEFINFINMQSSITFNKLNNLTTFSTNQINLLFQLANKESNTSNSTPSIHDFLNILNPNNTASQLNNDQTRAEILQNPNFVFFPIFDSLYNFSLGSVAGAIGATIVYPIDLIKTRMQAQRGSGLYKHSLDCLYKVVHFDGIRGLYSGLTPQLIGVAPEKAIKLTVNDLVRNAFTNKVSKTIPLSSEIMAGASAGACQVVFTNPLEIVKIRLQIGGYGSAMSIIRSLGIKGLYKGASACLLRDVPFSAIYFPTYAHIKKDIFNYDPLSKAASKRKKLKTWELLVSGGLAGMPAAFLTTPCDVIKTRLQVAPQKGETPYRGIFHALKTIVLEESWRSLFKGGAARVLRSSPQFGFTLAAYEIFQGLFPLPHGDGLKNIENPIHSDKTQANKPTLNIVNNGDKSILKNDNEGAGPNDYIVNPDKKVWYSHYNYKSLEISKKFIELDWNFKQFDYDVYKQFYDDIRKNNE